MDLPSLFKLAKNVSKHSDCNIKVGAVLVKHGKPVAIGYNKNRFNRKYSTDMRRTVHAEMSCLATSGKNIIKNATIFVYRENKLTGLPAMARPCLRCLINLKSFGVKKIYYTTGEFPFWNTEKI